MLTEIQTIILTCLLGPEDPKAFSKFQQREYKRAERIEDPEKLRERDRKRRPRGCEKNKIRGAKQRAKYPEAINESCRKSRLKRSRVDPAFRVVCNLRHRMYMVLCRAIAKKGFSSFVLLGTTVENWMGHLASLFKPGMTWENYGPVWHIDHIKPCAAFDLTDQEQQKICFHWSNTQPLFAADNISKGDKYVG